MLLWIQTSDQKLGGNLSTWPHGLIARQLYQPFVVLFIHTSRQSTKPAESLLPKPKPKRRNREGATLLVRRFACASPLQVLVTAGLSDTAWFECLALLALALLAGEVARRLPRCTKKNRAKAVCCLFARLHEVIVGAASFGNQHLEGKGVGWKSVALVRVPHLVRKVYQPRYCWLR